MFYGGKGTFFLRKTVGETRFILFVSVDRSAKSDFTKSEPKYHTKNKVATISVSYLANYNAWLNSSSNFRHPSSKRSRTISNPSRPS